MRQTWPVVVSMLFVAGMSCDDSSTEKLDAAAQLDAVQLDVSVDSTVDSAVDSVGADAVQIDAAAVDSAQVDAPSMDIVSNDASGDAALDSSVDIGGGTSGNSGAICDSATPCPDPANETCLYINQGDTHGMCLGKCNSFGDPCPVEGNGNLLSACLGQVPGQTQLYCMYVCENMGMSYDCPNSADYACQLIGSGSVIKACVPASTAQDAGVVDT